jgi:hypothetical protein
MPRLDIDLIANVARLQQDMNRAVGFVDKGFRDMKRAGDQVRSVLGIFGVGFSAFQVTRFVKQQIDAADAIEKLHLRTGIAIETLAGFDLVARKSGVSIEALATANKSLSKFVTDAQLGLKENQKILAALGITARNPTERLFQLADSIKAIEDPTLRQGIAVKLLGKSGDELIPILLQGGEALKKMVERGQQLSGVTDENARAAAKFNDDLADMNAEVGKLGLSIGTKLLPQFNILLKALREKATGRGGDLITNLGIEIARLQFDKQAARKISDQLIPPLEFDLKKFLAPVEKQFLKGNIFPAVEDDIINKTMCQTMGGAWDGVRCNLGADKFVERLNIQIAGIYGDVFAALREQARAGGFLFLVEGDIRRAEAARDAADATKYKNSQAELAIKADIENKKTTDDFLKSLRLTNQDLEFQAILFGRTAAEQEKLIALRRIDLDLAERIGRLDQEAPTFRNDVAALEASAAAGRAEVEKNLDELRQVSRSFETGIRDAMNRIIDDSTNAAAQVGGAFAQAFDRMEDMLVEFIVRGKLDFKGFVDSILADIVRIQIQQEISKPLAEFIGGLFGGGKAFGGPVSGGRAYVVGERGPELFVPRASGAIVPNRALGGPSIVVNQSNSFAAGVRAQDIVPLLPELIEATKAAVADEVHRGGRYSAIFRS